MKIGDGRCSDWDDPSWIDVGFSDVSYENCVEICEGYKECTYITWGLGDFAFWCHIKSGDCQLQTYYNFKSYKKVIANGKFNGSVNH